LPSILLPAQPIERVWGRRALPAWAGASAAGAPIGEVWHPDPAGDAAALLVKHIFTAERLSIQVHPDDAGARARGHARGKDEAWFILDAAPGAVIGLGLVREVAPAALRAAALDGSIESLVDWRPVRAGELIYSPAGTIHAIGAGISLVEIQQNLDLTYRLYDYGRPRALHLDDALAVATPGPYRFDPAAAEPEPGRHVLAAGGAFVVERWTGAGAARLAAPDGGMVLVPIADGGALDGHPLAAGTVWRIDGAAALDGDRRDLLVAYPGGRVGRGIRVAR
jgi:mannose-6-phosphate isomerase